MAFAFQERGEWRWKEDPDVYQSHSLYPWTLKDKLDLCCYCFGASLNFTEAISSFLGRAEQ